MRMGQGVRTGLGHGGLTCVLQAQFSSLVMINLIQLDIKLRIGNVQYQLKGNSHVKLKSLVTLDW